MSIEKMIISQAIGGGLFALFGGQPLLIVLCTAPFAIYTKLVYEISVQASLDFWALYGWVGVLVCILPFTI